jgi:hypothetical protein
MLTLYGKLIATGYDNSGWLLVTKRLVYGYCINAQARLQAMTGNKFSRKGLNC